jgi:hypothetical protein
MTLQTIKFSQFLSGGDLPNNSALAGLAMGTNVLFNAPWTFLASGTTLQRPAPSAATNYRLRFNTDNQEYEYFDAVSMVWVTLAAGGSGAPSNATYLLQVPNGALPMAQAMSALASGLVVNTTATGVQSTIQLAGTTNQIGITSPDGQSGNPTIFIEPNPIFTGTSGIGIPTGTTAQRPGSPIGTEVRFNTDLTQIEFWNGTTWVQFAVGGGVNPGTINDLAYYAATGSTISGLPTTASSILSTNSGGVPTWIGIVQIGNGGTGVSAVTTVPGTTVWAGWDANKNFSANNFIQGYTTTLTAAGTTVLTVASTELQYFTGTSAQTVQMPLTSTLVAGQQWVIVNNSTQSISIVTSASTAILTLPSGNQVVITCILNSGTTAASWSFNLALSGGVNPGTINQLAYYASTGEIVSGLATIASSILSSNAGGVPTWISTVSIANGGTGVNSVTTSPVATAWAGWDANKNLTANNFIQGYSTTATAAGTTVLTVASTELQYFTGTSAQTVQMPLTSTLVEGQKWIIVNNSTQTITVVTSASTTIGTLPASSQMEITCILNSGTTAASWSFNTTVNGNPISSIVGTANQVIVSGPVAGVYTLSLPQSIATTSNVTFGSLNFTTLQCNINGGQLLDNLGGPCIAFNDPGSLASNFMRFFGGATGTGPHMQAFGSDPNVTGNLLALGTGGWNIQGVSTSGLAPAGQVGELIQSVIPNASSVTFTSSTPANLTSISLTAGDWDLYGNITFTGTTITTAQIWISTTSATVPDKSLQSIINSTVSNPIVGLPAPSIPLSLPSTTTVYISGSVSGTGTLIGSGGIYARRRR